MRYFKFTKINTFIIIITLLFSCNPDKKTRKKQKERVHIISSPTDKKSSLPFLFTNKKDKIFLSWVTKINDSISQLNYSHLLNNKWQKPNEILTGDNWFVNWADFPSITENKGNLISHILKKSSKSTYSYDVKLNVLNKGADEWNTDLPLHIDSTKTEHGFVTTLPYKENSFFITWLDGRNMASYGHENRHNSKGAMNIRAAEISATGIVSNDVLLDTRTCSCCQTTAAITKNGPIVLYRDRSDEEIRDIVITRKVKEEWTTPKAIYNDNWKINGCPVNGPKAAVIDNNLVVAWYTAVNEDPKVKLVFSSDGGENFGEAILINEFGTLGRVDVILLDSKQAIVSWMATRNEKTYLKAMKVNKSGFKFAPVVISEMNDSRKTGFPQMERLGDKIFFAWTYVDADITNIKTAFVSLNNF